MTRSSTVLLLAGTLAVLFGALTLLKGGTMLQLAPTDRPAGVVSFVLIFNFVAGFFYLAGGVGILLKQAWSGRVAQILAVTTAIVFVALGLHIYSGGEFMPRTIAAMTLRTGFWVIQSLFLTAVFK